MSVWSDARINDASGGKWMPMMDGDGHCWRCWGLMSTEGARKGGGVGWPTPDPCFKHSYVGGRVAGLPVTLLSLANTTWLDNNGLFCACFTAVGAAAAIVCYAAHSPTPEFQPSLAGKGACRTAKLGNGNLEAQLFRFQTTRQMAAMVEASISPTECWRCVTCSLNKVAGG
jgi:hypothetical protein